jgi:hypothetical protein
VDSLVVESDGDIFVRQWTHSYIVGRYVSKRSSTKQDLRVVLAHFRVLPSGLLMQLDLYIDICPFGLMLEEISHFNPKLIPRSYNQAPLSLGIMWLKSLWFA